MPQPDQENHRIGIVCHKGANGVAPENTYAAAQQALDWGADYVEVDVWTSRDGEMVLMHDATVDRTTNGTGHVLALTTAELQALDAGSWFAPEFAGERIPLLRDFLHWIKGKAQVFFDIKFAHPQQLLDLLDETGMRDACFLWSASDLWMALTHELDPGITIKANVSSTAELTEAEKAFGARIIEVGLDKINTPLVAACRERGLKVMILELSQDAEAFRRAIAWRPDLINLDHADLFQATLTEGERG
jgi:glycerophosphoryl diester phosphodiesterase